MLSQKQPLSHPMFILSCERSGSTLLRYIVDTHADIACQAGLAIGALCAALYRSAYYSVGQAVASSEIERSSRVIEKIRQIITALMAEYTTAKGKRLWCDKTPANLHTLDVLGTVFPDGKFICLYRHGMDVIHSCLEISSRNGFAEEFDPYLRKYPENLTAAMVDSWTDKTGKLLAFERANQRKCFRITYETLVLNTVPTLEAMFAFLGLRFDPKMLDSVFRVHHDEGVGDDRIRFSKEISKRSLGKGSKVPVEKIPSELLEKLNALLSELNYPTVGPDWNNSPSPYLQPETTTEERKVTTTVEEIFGGPLPVLLKRKIGRAAERGVCKFAVSGEGGGNWLINLAEQSIRKDRGELKPDCVVTVSATDFIDMVSGRLNVMSAYDRGKIRVTGDGNLATKIGVLLFGT